MTEWRCMFPPPGELINLNRMSSQARFNRNRNGSRQLVKLWRDAAYFRACEMFPGVGPEGRRLPPCEVYTVLPVEGERRRDPSNWMPTVKAIVDGFTRAGLWPDDNEEWVTQHNPRLARDVKLVVVRMVPR